MRCWNIFRIEIVGKYYNFEYAYKFLSHDLADAVERDNKVVVLFLLCYKGYVRTRARAFKFVDNS